MGTIYIIENKIDGKCYVGQTIQPFKDRLSWHYKHGKQYVDNALRKHGMENFNKIIFEDIPEEKLDELEIQYIQKYNSLFPNGYNFETGGHKNKHPCEETKKKIGETKKGNTNMLGKHHTEESKKKMSKSSKKNMLGKHHTEEAKKKMSESHKEQVPWNKGIPLTEEHKRKDSEAHKGEKNPFFGKHHAEEHKRKMSESNKGKHLSIKTEFKKGQIPWNKGKKFA